MPQLVDVDNEARAALLEQGKRMLDVFLGEYSELNVVRTEARFELEPEYGGCPFVGYLDAVLRDATLLEFKPAARRYSDLEINLQFKSYRHAAREPGAKELRVIAILKTQSPKLQDIALQPATDAESRWFRTLVNEVQRAAEAGVFPPAPSHRCASCEHRGACEESA